MARTGVFGGGLSPFGHGALNLDDVYRIESPQPTTSPPVVSAPPGRTPPPTDRSTVPTPKPPVVGKVPTPGRKPVARKPVRPVARPVARPPVRAAAPKPPRRTSTGKRRASTGLSPAPSPDLYTRLRYMGQQLPTPPQNTGAR